MVARYLKYKTVNSVTCVLSDVWVEKTTNETFCVNGCGTKCKRKITQGQEKLLKIVRGSEQREMLP